MGLNIADDRSVSFDDSHQLRVDTSLENNPRRETLGDVDVTHIFRRNKTGDLDRDGNPLIYALKGMKSYSIADAEKTRFLDRAFELCRSINYIEADVIVAVPSSKDFCLEFSQAASTALRVDVCSEPFVVKSTVAAALDRAKQSRPDIKNRYARKSYNKQLAAWEKMGPNRFVSMKEIDTKIRGYFQPFALSHVPEHLIGKRVLLIDDLMSSGTSMRTCAKLLMDNGIEARQGLFFLSGI